MKTIRTLFAALMIGAAGLNAASAADTKTDEPKTEAKTEPKPVQPVILPGQLTSDKLKEMLDTLGYDFTVQKATNGANLYMVKIRRKGLDYEVNVNISSSGTMLWTSVYLAEVKPEHAAQADKILKLLELNQKIGPTHFYYYAPFKAIYATKPMNNRGVTPKLLREHIDDLMEQVVANEQHWNVDKWGTTTTASKLEK